MIATPTDSYDRRTCIVSTLNSLEQLSRSFDTAMDSLLISTEQLELRLESMKQRTMNLSFEHVNKIEAPSVYPIMDDSTSDYTSHSRKVRAACQEQIISNPPFVDVKDESTVSDLWLDRASAFEERQACRQALESLVMPSILSLSPTKAEDWKEVSTISTNNHDRNGSVQRESQQPDLDMMSTTSTISARTTATARWNYHKYKKQTREQGTKNSSKFRQEAMKGSLPYLCDVLHDAYSSKRFEPQPNNILQYYQLQHESQQQQPPKNDDTDNQNEKEMKIEEQSTPVRATSKNVDVSDDEKEQENSKIDLNQSTELILPKLVDIDRKGHVPLPNNLPF